MRAMLAVLVVLALAPTARAQDAPPPPPEPLPTTEVAPPLPIDEPPPPIEPPNDNKPPDFTPAPKPKPPDHKPPPPEAPAIGFGGDACWGSSMACVVGGCLPSAATALGATILISMISAGVADGSCGGIVLVVLGVVYGGIIGAPGALLLGPCASCSAATGGVALAALNDRDLVPVMLGSLPGIALGVLGSGGVLWGLFALDGAVDYTLPVALLGTGVGLALLSGPATVVGISVADAMAGESKADDANKAVPKPDDPRSDPDKTQVAMRY